MMMMMMMKRSSYQKIVKYEHWTTFCESCEQTGSIERTVMTDFKMCCLYVVLVLPGSVEAQLG